LQAGCATLILTRTIHEQIIISTSVKSCEVSIVSLAGSHADRCGYITTTHAEATPHIHGALQKIRAAGVKPSLVINPGTPVEAVKNVLNLVDQVLVMTVNPGFGGQAFLPETMDKIRELVVLREVNQLNFDIEVDGGIDDKTIGIAKEAGANVFVAGSYVFKGDVNHQVQTLRDALHD